jgi:hypothetical protein
MILQWKPIDNYIFIIEVYNRTDHTFIIEAYNRADHTFIIFFKHII